MLERQSICEYCLENRIILEGIEIKGERVGWYEHPATLTWEHEGCDNCERMVKKVFHI